VFDWVSQTEERLPWWGEISRRVIRSLLENWEMKTPEPNSAAIPAARSAEDELPLQAAVVEAVGEEEDVSHVSTLCLIRQHGDTDAGEPKWFASDLPPGYPQSV
jgi:hypothetical protein